MLLAQISTLIVAANVGVMLFFSVAVAPSIFVVLPSQWAATYVRAFFPKYYLYLGLLTAVAAGLAASMQQQLGLALCALLFFFSRWWLTPQINKARDEKRAQAFKVLHILSVALNLLQLLGLIGFLVQGFR